MAGRISLGRAYHLSGNEKYAELSGNILSALRRVILPTSGPHWMNGQEVAIRLLAFVWAAQVLKALRLQARFAAPQAYSIHCDSCRHGSRQPSSMHGHRNNNHLILEAAALFTAGIALNRPNGASLGWSWLNRGLQRQISSYGEYIQHSTNYHRLMLQTMLWVDAILRRRGETLASGNL